MILRNLFIKSKRKGTLKKIVKVGIYNMYTTGGINFSY